MQLPYIFLLYSIIVLIKIGDLIITFIAFIFRLARFGAYAVKKRQKRKATVLFPLPFKVKIKYFIFGGIFSFILIFLPLLLFIFLSELPSPKVLSFRQLAQTTKIFDRNGTFLYEIYASENRTIVPLSQIPKYLQDATIAIEDKNFYNHPGFDIPSIARAARETLLKDNPQGGSTITQQLIRSSILTNEQTLTRKIKEVILAYWAERMYTKKQILEMYFNQIPYGGTAWGVQAAAEVYFGKKTQELTLAESAFLSGIASAPSRYSPYGQNSLWKTRQHEVLNKMLLLGFITKSQKQEAEREPLVFKRQEIPIHAPHFVMFVKDQLIKKYGLAMVERGGLNVVTSLDLPLQKMAEQIVNEEVEKAMPLHVTNGAALITDPKTGDILAMVGSKDFADQNGGNVNITTSLRQPGSSIKAITYSAALANGFTAATIIDDSPVTYTTTGAKPYSPVNYGGRFFGRMPLRLAFANSVNIPAVKVLNKIGIDTMVNLGKKMGITSWGKASDFGLSITLGSAEVSMVDLTTVYGVFANGGKKIEVSPILKITDQNGDIIAQKQPQEGVAVIDEGIAFIVSHILADNNARMLVFGSNSSLYIQNHTVSVKTGTSDNKRDNWTVGYTNNYVVTTWVGNNDNSPMSEYLASGVTGAAPIWNRIMTKLLEKNPEKQPLVPPSDIVMKSCFGRIEYFLKGTENSIRCSYETATSNASPQTSEIRQTTPAPAQSGSNPTPTPTVSGGDINKPKQRNRGRFFGF